MFYDQEYTNYLKTFEDAVFEAKWKEHIIEKKLEFNPHVDYCRICIEEYEEPLYRKGAYNELCRGGIMERQAFDSFMKAYYYGVHEDRAKSKRTPPQIAEFAYGEYLRFKKKDFKRYYYEHKKERVEEGLMYYFITLNFKADADIGKVIKHTNRFVHLAIFKGCRMLYTYEYYGQHGTHPHVHILCELNRTGSIQKPFSKIPEYAFKDKSILEVMGHKEAIDIKVSKHIDSNKRARPREECVAYATGKKCLDKQQNCDKDIEWRKKNNLEQTYFIDCV